MLLELCCVARGKGCHRVKHGHTLERFHPVDASTLWVQTMEHVRDIIQCSGIVTGEDKQFAGVETMAAVSKEIIVSRFPSLLADEWNFFGWVKIWRLWRRQLSPPTETADLKDLCDHVWNFWNPIIKSKSCVGSMWRESKSSGTKRACALHLHEASYFWKSWRQCYRSTHGQLDIYIYSSFSRSNEEKDILLFYVFATHVTYRHKSGTNDLAKNDKLHENAL